MFFKAFWEEIYRSDKPVASFGETTTTPAHGRNNSDNNDNDRAMTGTPQPPPTTATRENSIENPTPTPLPPAPTPSSNPPSSTTPLRRTARPRARREDTPHRADTPSTTAPTPRRGGAARGWKKRVRTDNAHIIWLEHVYGFQNKRAKMLVKAWDQMGFLDESAYGEWVRRGGIFAEGGVGGWARE
jgi:hypothetical protein